MLRLAWSPHWLAHTAAHCSMARAAGLGFVAVGLPIVAPVAAQIGSSGNQTHLIETPEALALIKEALTQKSGPDAPVIAFMGDAGLEMTLGELATLRDLALPLVVVVFVDRSLSLIELKQRGSAMQNAGVDFQRTDFAALARVYGGNGVTVTSPGDTGPAVTQALAADRFTIVAVEIPRRAYDGLF